MIGAVGLFGLFGLFGVEVAHAQVTNLVNNTQYPSLTAAVNAAGAGDVLVVDPGTWIEVNWMQLTRDVVIEGAGVDLTTITIGDPAPEAVFQLDPGVSAVFRDLTIVGAGYDQGVVLAPQDDELLFERVALSGARPTTAVVMAYDPVLVEITDADISGVDGPGYTGAGVGVIGSGPGFAPVVLTDVRFTGLDASDIGSGFVGSFVDLTCVRCSFVDMFPGAINVQPDGAMSITESRFCGSGFVFGIDVDATVASSVFVGTSVIGYAGVWTLTNDTILDPGPEWPAAVYDFGGGWTFSLTNTLVWSDGPAIALQPGAPPPALAYDWFYGSADPLPGLPPVSSTNHVAEGDPLLVDWPGGDCATAALYPTPLVSPLIDAGDPSIVDLDGSRSDIGAFGGPSAPRDPVGTDGDGDGAWFLHDCDDGDDANRPGDTEVCDGGDNDCDALADDADPDLDLTTAIAWYPDCDLDGQGASAAPTLGCVAPASGCDGWATSDVDCDDADPTVYVGADERCLDGDQSCDGDPDFGAVDATTVYIDADVDGYGAGAPLFGCVGPGLAIVDGDCDDADPEVHPGHADTCGDHRDQNCDGGDGDPSNQVGWYLDADQDGYGDESAVPVYDCDLSPAYTRVAWAQDCNDTRADVFPNAVEVCDGVDQDCDGELDEVPPETWYRDADGDGFGNHSIDNAFGCPQPGWVADGTDCDDALAEVHPGAVELCNGVDDDCDTVADNTGDPAVWYEDSDADGVGNVLTGRLSECPPADDWVLTKGDCDDEDPTRIEDCSAPKGLDTLVAEDDGCGCAAGQRFPGGLGLLAGAAALLVRRRAGDVTTTDRRRPWSRRSRA